jgi:hypothetical protein
MGSAAPVGGDDGAGRGLGVDAASAAGGGGGMRRQRGYYLSMSCVELWGGRGGINFCSLGGRNLVIGEVTPNKDSDKRRFGMCVVKNGIIL